ncbi:MAG: GntR family transcriptional regulator [Actinobacteria bacterium]|nr:MAG: GntR family transcriptional regulator [Actinomycetota bacterium]
MTVVLKHLLRRVERAGPPAHTQIEERLAEAMAAGELRPGDRLPPERELAERFGVSRMTLRHALDSLAGRGMLVRARGRRGGTFVGEPKIERDLTTLAGLTHQLRRQGHRAGARVLAAREGPASRRTAGALRLEPGDRVYEVVRVRLSDGEPLALERSLFPAGRFPDLLDQPLDASLYELLEQRYREPPVRAVERLEPVVADADEAEALGVKEGAPLLLVERVAYSAEGVPLEYARDLFRGDRTRVLVESGLPAPEAGR